VSTHKPHLGALSGIRFFAAFNVVLFHLWNGQNFHLSSSFLTGIVSSGYVGVSFFFVLSGFIHGYAYGPERVGSLGVSKFYRGRIARIYPVYLLALLLAAWTFVHSAPLGKLVVPGATVLTMTQAWMPSTAMAWNYPSWTMSSELLFYLLFPFLAPPIARLSRRGLLVLAAVSLGVMLAIPTTYLIIAPDGFRHVQSNYGSDWLNTVKFNPLCRLPEFVIGLALGYHFTKTKSENSHVSSANVAHRWGDLLAGAAIVLIALTLGFSAHLPYLYLHNGGMIPMFGLLLYGLALGGRISRMLSNRALSTAGDASYAMYLIQAPVFTWLVAAHVIGKPHYVAIYIVVLLLASFLVLQFFEKPARNWFGGGGARGARLSPPPRTLPTPATAD
jgi:peptidoglycan/LPS O-acetylase OafA/YrhL